MSDEPPDGSSSTPEPSVDEVLVALSDGRRRGVLYYLRDNGGVAEFDELCRYLAARSDADAEAIGVSLRHVALPRLRDIGVVRYDPAAERVWYRRRPLVDELVDRLADRESDEE